MCLPRNHVYVSFHQLGYVNQTSTPISGTDGVLYRYAMCYNCDRPGHYFGQCTLPYPYLCKIVTHPLQLGYFFAHTTPVQKSLIILNWILLNSCSSVSSFMDPYLLSYIKDFHSETAIRVFTNSVNLDYKQSGTMDMFPLKVFYNPDYIANILEFFLFSSQFKVSMDTNN